MCYLAFGCYFITYAIGIDVFIAFAIFYWDDCVAGVHHLPDLVSNVRVTLQIDIRAFGNIHFHRKSLGSPKALFRPLIVQVRINDLQHTWCRRTILAFTYIYKHDRPLALISIVNSCTNYRVIMFAIRKQDRQYRVGQAFIHACNHDRYRYTARFARNPSVQVCNPHTHKCYATTKSGCQRLRYQVGGPCDGNQKRGQNSQEEVELEPEALALRGGGMDAIHHPTAAHAICRYATI